MFSALLMSTRGELTYGRVLLMLSVNDIVNDIASDIVKDTGGICQVVE